MSHKQPLILQVVGYKNSGKTTTVSTIVSYIKEKYEYRIATIKHDAHRFTFDRKGTDTWSHRQAGADMTLISSSQQIGILITKQDERVDKRRKSNSAPLEKDSNNLQPVEERDQQNEEISSLVDKLISYDDPHLIIVEGYKWASYPKIFIIRHEQDLKLLNQLDRVEHVILWHQEDYNALIQQADKQAHAYKSYSLKEDHQLLLNWIDHVISDWNISDWKD